MANKRRRNGAYYKFEDYTSVEEGVFMDLTYSTHGKATPNDFVVLIHCIRMWNRLTNWENNNGRIEIDPKEISEFCNISKSSVYRSINNLVGFGYLGVTNKTGFKDKKKASTYRLLRYPVATVPVTAKGNLSLV